MLNKIWFRMHSTLLSASSVHVAEKLHLQIFQTAHQKSPFLHGASVPNVGQSIMQRVYAARNHKYQNTFEIVLDKQIQERNGP